MSRIRTATALAAGRVELVESGRSAPGPGEVAGETLWTLVSPGTELAMSGSSEPRYPYPVQLGYAAVFRIIEVGDGVTGHAVGDVVMCMGPHASWQCCSAAEVTRVPAALDPRTATYVRMLNVPMTAIATSTARPGHKVAVLGLGLVGQMSVRSYAASGFDVVAVDPGEERRAAVPSGIEVRPDLPEAAFDVVVECSGREEAAIEAARGLRSGGELIVTGVPWRRRSDSYLYELLDLLFHKFLVVRSGWEWQVPRTPGGAPHGLDMTALLCQGMSWLASGAVDITGLDTVIAPDDLPRAYETLRARQAPTLTYSIRWSGAEPSAGPVARIEE
jgi:threonine dehydrogenase-like Zn-dependent dehydrogenase